MTVDMVPFDAFFDDLSREKRHGHGSGAALDFFIYLICVFVFAVFTLYNLTALWATCMFKNKFFGETSNTKKCIKLLMVCYYGIIYTGVIIFPNTTTTYNDYKSRSFSKAGSNIDNEPTKLNRVQGCGSGSQVKKILLRNRHLQENIKHVEKCQDKSSKINY